MAAHEVHFFPHTDCCGAAFAFMGLPEDTILTSGI